MLAPPLTSDDAFRATRKEWWWALTVNDLHSSGYASTDGSIATPRQVTCGNVWTYGGERERGGANLYSTVDNFLYIKIDR